MKNVVHEILEGGGSIRESERDNIVFEGSKAGTEGGFPLVALSNSHKVVRIRKVESGENLSGTKLVKKVGN